MCSIRPPPSPHFLVLAVKSVCPCSFHQPSFFLCLLQDELMESSSDEEESGLQDEKKTVFDVEDLGNMMNRTKKAKVTVKLYTNTLTSTRLFIKQVRKLLISTFSVR